MNLCEADKTYKYSMVKCPCVASDLILQELFGCDSKAYGYIWVGKGILIWRVKDLGNHECPSTTRI